MINPASMANGWATIMPRNMIGLNNFPPMGDGHLTSIDGWIQGLVLHELTHILHMDQTSGFLNVLESVFGNIGKMGGLVPRWFSEGLAVWAETHFTQGGRLRSKLLEYELDQVLLDPASCKTPDCLDDPGVYPNRQMPYWVGGYFMDYLEKKKPGTIRCLIKENSNSILFFLNTAFKKCTNQYATPLFTEFRNDRLAKIEARNKQFAPLGKGGFEQLPLNDPLRFDWQKGSFITNDKLMAVRINENTKVSEIFEADLNNNLTQKTYRPAQGIYMLMPPSVYSERNDEFFMTTFPHVRSWGLKWLSNKRSDNFDFEEHPNYLFRSADGGYLYLRYHLSRWKIFHQTKEDEENPQLLYEFPLMSSVQKPQLVNVNSMDQLFYSSSDFDPEGETLYRLYQLDFSSKKNKPQLVYESVTPLTLWGVCHDKRALFSTDQHNFMVAKFDGGLEIEHVNLDKSPWLVDAAKIYFSKNKTAALFNSEPGKLYTQNRGCSEVLNSLELYSGRTPFAADSDPTKSEEAKLVKTEGDEISNYFALKYMAPTFWMLGYGFDGDTSVYNAYTTLGDPKRKHMLNLAVDYYSEFELFSGSSEYRYSIWGPIGISVAYDKGYRKNSITSRRNENEKMSAGFNVMAPLGNWFYQALVTWSDEEVNDFVSAREVNIYSLAQEFNRSRILADDFVQRFSLFVQAFRQHTVDREYFWGLQSSLETSFRLHRNFHVHLRGTYGKLDKDNFSSGIIYGGGSRSIDTSAFHEFYGLSYTDIYGNRIITGKGQLDVSVLEPRTAGGGLFPMYLKHVNLLAGYQYVKADRIFIGRNFLRNKNLKGYHGGLRVKATGAFMLPIEFDFIGAKVLNPYGDDEDSFLVLSRIQMF
jgi:hypothetical protein